MVRYWKDIIHYEQPASSLLKEKAKSTAAREKKKGNTLEPVTVNGRQLVNSWW